ncbi:MAG: tetratricopeptide repeat protein [Candidatus Thiodiazotropha sp. (ex Dulcina madagascariensis)]|nr:tetratricopeptide repeat protein [Candidatus Thiodiazotropha sp. (ex Dulcina madagascariensis)]MCU7927989.1 tetratricopeptide repeat protein [Candidatus Thiodiazotropha sp. (ex Dulcina madagascariensis)]
MRAEELLQQGDLEGALQELQQAVRSEPSHAKFRVFLFQLLCVLGEWERALTQLDVAGDLDPLNLPMAQTYREAIRCELFRRQVFSGDKSPLVFGDPPQWSAYLIEALHLSGRGKYAQSDQLRGQAFDLAPGSSGTIDEQSFAWIADADTRLGPMLEAIVNGRYYWIPMQRLKQVDIDPPEDLRDMVWAPAHLTFENQGETVALIPARYPSTESESDSALKLSRKTEWQEPFAGHYIGLGQRMLATDADEYPLLSTTQILFHTDSGAE